MGTVIRPGKRTPIGSNIKNRDCTTAVSLADLATEADAQTAVYAQIQAAGAAAYLTTDGVVPTSSSYGRTLASGEGYDVAEDAAEWGDIMVLGDSVSIMFSA